MTRRPRQRKEKRIKIPRPTFERWLERQRRRIMSRKKPKWVAFKRSKSGIIKALGDRGGSRTRGRRFYGKQYLRSISHISEETIQKMFNDLYKK